LFFKEDDTDLTISLEMLIIIFNDKSIVTQRLLCIAKLVQNLSKPKVSRYTCWVEFNAVLEVLLSFVEITTVCKLGSQMDACAKVALVVKQTLLEVVYRVLEFFDSFILATKMEMSL
jgi:hypothetical protein